MQRRDADDSAEGSLTRSAETGGASPLDPPPGDPLAAAQGLAARAALMPAVAVGNGIDPLANGRDGIETELDNEIYAAIDLGTNNCRLLIARARGRGFRVIDAFSRIVRLGEGLGANGTLSAEAMDRTVDALRICVEKMSRRGVTRARSVATEACRRASNGVAFLNRVEAEVGLRLEIITPQQEAELAFRGCAPLLARDPRRAILFDIGGGSTEVGWVAIRPGRGIELLAYRSLPLGVVNLAERHGGRAYCEKSYGAMVEEVADALAPLEAQCGIAAEVREGRVQMLGSSGTVTTLAGIEMQLERYDRSRVDGTWLDFGAIGAISRRLAAMDCATRAQQPCIGRERADLVVAGCAILEGICRLWPVGRLRVADRGLREGILFGLMQPSSSISPPRFRN